MANDAIPSKREDVILARIILISATCVLSMLGSLLILFTYVAFKSLRTTARHILANLSVADFAVAVAHIVGALVNLRRSSELEEENKESDARCIAQAVVLMYSTLTSFLWTIALAVYMVAIITSERITEIRTWLLVVFHVLCWGLPVVPIIGLGASDYLGYDGDIGFCYIRRWPQGNSSINHTILGEMIGYSLWSYITFITITGLYIYLFIRVRRSSAGCCSCRMQSRDTRADLKLILVPGVFLFLRGWSFIVDIYAFYFPEKKAEDIEKTWTNAALILLAGIGVCAQGFANAILFCVFTRVVRQKLLTAFLRPWPKCVCVSRYEERVPLLENEPSTVLESHHLSHQMVQESPACYGGDDVTPRSINSQDPEATKPP